MSFITTKRINPHLLIHALAQHPLNTHADTPLLRLSLLATTRRFGDILGAASGLDNIGFPTLAQKIKIAQEQNETQKSSLNAQKAYQRLSQLQKQSQSQNPNYEIIDAGHQQIFDIAHILFQQGQYAQSLKLLVQLQKQDMKQQLWLKVTWVRVYCQILTGRDCVGVLERLKKKMEDISGEELSFALESKKNVCIYVMQSQPLIKKYYAQNQQFLILLLFSVFINGKAAPQYLQKLVQIATTDNSYFSVLQLTLPQMLRYLIAAMALNKTLQLNRNFDLFKLVQVINRKVIKHTDALTQYMALLEVDYDFQGAKGKIQQCRTVIRQDIFLVNHQQAIIQGLHFLYFKLACKMYQSIPLSEIAQFTGKSQDNAQLWILGYIRSGDIEAKIDCVNEMVVNSRGRNNPAEKYMDVVPGLSTFVNSLSRAIHNQ